MLLLAKTVGDLLHHGAAIGGVAHVLRLSDENGTGAKYVTTTEQKPQHENDCKQKSTGRKEGGGGVGYQRVESEVVVRNLCIHGGFRYVRERIKR